MELIVANKEYVVFYIYRPPKQNINYVLKSLSDNATPSYPRLTLFLENQILKSIVKNPKCFRVDTNM